MGKRDWKIQWKTLLQLRDIRVVRGAKVSLSLSLSVCVSILLYLYTIFLSSSFCFFFFSSLENSVSGKFNGSSVGIFNFRRERND